MRIVCENNCKCSGLDRGQCVDRYPYVYSWKKRNLFGLPCRIIKRTTNNKALVDFGDHLVMEIDTGALRRRWRP